mgnify:CR=1 FL=1
MITDQQIQQSVAEEGKQAPKDCVLLVMSPYSSHLIPTYQLARRFQESGHEVVYVSSPRFEQEIVHQGFGFQSTTVVESGKFLPTDQLINFLALRYQPYLWLVEVSFWTWGLFLQDRKLPFMMIQTWPCCNRAPYSLPEGYRFLGKRNLYNRLKSAWLWRRHNRQVRQQWIDEEGNQFYHDTIAQTGLSPDQAHISRHNRVAYPKVLGAKELILYPKELDIPRKQDPNTIFIGPFLNPDREEEELPYDLENEQRPVVYCSMGSLSRLFRQRQTFYERVIEAFANRPDRFLVMTVGKNNHSFLNREYPGNIRVVDYAPQFQVLQDADAFITHGGAGSLKESIWHGVPMLVYPWDDKSDRFGNADRVAFHQLGLIGDVLEDSAIEVNNKLDQLLSDPQIKTGMAQMKQTFHDYAKKETNILEQLKTEIYG